MKKTMLALAALAATATLPGALAQDAAGRAVDGEPHLMIYIAPTLDHRSGPATGHPEFTSRKRCEDAKQMLIQGARVQRHATPDYQSRLGEPLVFCAAK